MQDTRIVFPGYELEVEQDGQWIEPGPGSRELDPEWRYVDRQGHGHFVADGDDRLPTLEWVAEECSMGHGEDCDAEGHFRCRTCEEEIKPGTRPSKAVYVAGPETYYLAIKDGNSSFRYALSRPVWIELNSKLMAVTKEFLKDYVIEMTQSSW